MSSLAWLWVQSRARISKIGFALFGSFTGLMVLELLDGDQDLADLLAPLLWVLFINHLYIICTKEHLPERSFREECERGNGLYAILAKIAPGISPLFVKWGMNTVLALCLITPIVLDAFSFDPQQVKFSALAAVSLWSLCLFTVSIKELKGHLRIVRLFYCNLALCVFVISVFYF